jgi:hypothetical protein
MSAKFPIKKCLGGLIFLFLILFAPACGTEENADPDYLLRIDDLMITSRDYMAALDVMKAAYPYEALQDGPTLMTLKARLLKQLTGELVLAKRAEELGLSISDVELNQAMEKAAGDSPENILEKRLLEKAISPAAWKERLRMQILAEKVVDRELIAAIRLTPEDVKAYYQKRVDGRSGAQVAPGEIDQALVKEMRREAAQKLYPQWFDTLQQRYVIELNEEQWQIIYNQKS